VTGTTLIIGADSYIGRRVAAAVLASGDDSLILTVRAGHPGEFSVKRDRLAAELGPEAHNRITYIVADLRSDDALCNVPTGKVTRIMHAAAITRLGVEADVVRRVNVDGTRRVLDLAARCENLERFALLSTLYSAGRQVGEVPEQRHPDAGFVNHFEWSKWAAEEEALAAGDLPLSVLRLPTVVADDDSGKVVQYNAFHNTMKLFYDGLLSLVPGDPATPLSLATASFTTSAVAHLLDPRSAAGIYHICPGSEATLTLGQLLDVVFDVYERDEHYHRRRILRPIYCDRAGFEDLVDVAARFQRWPIEDSLFSVAPFGMQLYLGKTFRNDALRAAWPGYAAPDPVALAEAVARHLVTTRWGRTSPVRRPSSAPIDDFDPWASTDRSRSDRPQPPLLIR
jgi:nucleoside-diphosphate-sugar epimerase